MDSEADLLMELDFSQMSADDKLIIKSGMFKKSRSMLQRTISMGAQGIKQRISAPPFIRTIDKISFVLGILFLIVTEWVILVYPAWMPTWYIMTIFPLMLARFVLYRRQKFHYFMLDFCYFAQGIMTFFMVFYPNSSVLFQLVFCFTNGPLLFGIVMWSNSLVFHDIDKVTSVAIHFLPPLVSYALRWHALPKHVVCPRGDCTLSLGKVIYLSFYFYLFWQVTYLLKTEIVDRIKLDKDKGIITSARWMSVKKPHPLYVYCQKRQDRNAFFKFFVNNPWALLSAIQLVYTMTCILVMPFIYGNEMLHSGLLIFVLMVCLWNGSNFYFDVFAKAYQKRLETLVKEKKPGTETGKRTAEDENE